MAALDGDLDFYRWAANAPQVAAFYWGDFYGDLFFGGVLPVRIKELVRLRLAALTGCAFCSVGDRSSARSHGVDDASIDAAFVGSVTAFTDEREVAALQIATAVADGDPGRARPLLRCFTPEEGVELVMVAGVLAGVGRMLVATGFVPVVCPAPRAD